MPIEIKTGESVLRLGEIVHYIISSDRFLRCELVDNTSSEETREYSLKLVALLGDWEQPYWNKTGDLVKSYHIKMMEGSESKYMTGLDVNYIYEVNERWLEKQPFFGMIEEKLKYWGVEHPNELNPIKIIDPLPLTKEQIELADKWRKLAAIKKLFDDALEKEKYLGDSINDPQDRIDEIIEIIKTKDYSWADIS